MRWRPALSLGVIAALAVAVWAALSSGEEEAPATTTTTTLAPATSSALATTTTAAPPTTATTVDTTSSTATPATTISPEARREEVRLILEDLWFRWFDAVYRNDEDAVLDVVATSAQLDAFNRARSQAEWQRGPLPEEVVIEDLEILLDEESCLVTYSTVVLDEWLGGDTNSVGVDVLFPSEHGWRFASHWVNRGDLWEADCRTDRSDELP